MCPKHPNRSEGSGHCVFVADSSTKPKTKSGGHEGSLGREWSPGKQRCKVKKRKKCAKNFFGGPGSEGVSGVLRGEMVAGQEPNQFTSGSLGGSSPLPLTLLGGDQGEG